MDFEAYLTALRGKTVSVIGIGVSNRPLIEKLLEKGVAVTAGIKRRVWASWAQNWLRRAAS